jgi:hypothetical protein
MTAAYREIIAKNTVALKSSILDTISDVFKQAASASVYLNTYIYIHIYMFKYI